MNNYNKALEITDMFCVFFDAHYKKYITSKDLLKLTDYCENIVMPTLTAKQVFNDDLEASVGCRFLIPLDNGNSVSALITYTASDGCFGVDSVMMSDKIGLPINDGVNSGWVDEYYEKDLFKIRK